MSGVYICGIPMPKENSLRLIIHPNGEVVFPTRNYAETWPGVKAIPIPDHGRLVDADDVNNHIHGWVDLRTCPTIIPADKEGEK